MKLQESYKNFFFLNFPIILISAIPLLLITGPFLTDLSLSIVSVLYLVVIIKEKKYKLLNIKFFYIFLIFYFYIFLNSLFQNQNFDSLKISFFYFRFGVFALAMVYFLNREPKLLKYIYYCIMICFIILIFDGLYQYFAKKNLFGYELIYPGPRVSSFFGDELILGSYLSRLFPIFFGLFLYFSKTQKDLYYFIPVWIFTIILIFLSGERTAIFFLSLSLFMMFFLIIKHKIYIRAIILLFIFFGTLILVLSEASRERIINDTIKQMFLSKWDSKKIFIFSRQHDEHYFSAIKMFKDNKLYGVGVKNFRNFCHEKRYNFSDYTCSPHPHNTYIQLLSETGLIGFIIFFSAFIYLNYKLLRHFLLRFKKIQFFNDKEVCMLIAIYVTLWPFIPSGNFFNNWLSTIYYFPIGILIWSFTSRHKKF